MSRQYPLGIEDDNFWKNYVVDNVRKYVGKGIIEPVDGYEIVYHSLDLLDSSEKEEFFKKLNKLVEENPRFKKAVERDYKQYLKTLA